MSDTSNFSPIFTTCHPSSIHEAHCRYLSCCGHFFVIFLQPGISLLLTTGYMFPLSWITLETCRLPPKSPCPHVDLKSPLYIFFPLHLPHQRTVPTTAEGTPFFEKHEHGAVTSDMWRHRKTLTYLQTVPSSEVQYGMRSYFNVHSKADISQLNLLHGTKKTKSEKRKKN